MKVSTTDVMRRSPAERELPVGQSRYSVPLRRSPLSGQRLRFGTLTATGKEKTNRPRLGR